MKTDSIITITRAGMGSGPADLQKVLISKYLTLTLASGELPSKILFYTEGVQLVCAGSPVLDTLHQMEAQGVELVLCKTCLDYFGLTDQVKVGVVGGMGDILEAMQKAPKVISL